MRQFSIILVVLFLSFGCCQLPQGVKSRNVFFVIYGAIGETVKISNNGILVFDKRISKPTPWGWSDGFYLPRTKEKMHIVVQWRGRLFKFAADPQHFGDVEISFGLDGSVIIKDGSKKPPRKS